MLNSITTSLWNKKYIVLFFAIFLIVLSQRFLNIHQNGLVNSVSSDGLGYYSYLPAAIIYQDFDYTYYEKKENKINPFYNPFYNPYSSRYKDKKINKYFCGTAICLTPFFLLGIGISAIAGTEINGYTDTFLMLVSIASIVYFLLSVFLIGKIADHFSISKKISFWVSIVFFFGTNLFHYVVQEPSMSHCYSFFAITLFFYIITRLIQTKSNKFVFLTFASLGLIALLRPTNSSVILFVPFFFESFKAFFEFVKSLVIKKYLAIIGSIILFFLIIFIQLIFYYLQTGDFIVYSYQEASFNFDKPEIVNILFSYKKGLFIYTPIIFASLLLIVISKLSWYKKTILLLAFFVFTYIAASWFYWSYGGCFGNRAFVEVYPIFIISIIVILNKLNLRFKRVLVIISLPFVFANQMMAYQYCNSIMDSTEVTKEAYWDMFMNPSLGSINEKRFKGFSEKFNICKQDYFDMENLNIEENIVLGGYKSNKASYVGDKYNYSKGVLYSIKKDLNLDETFYVFAECMMKPADKVRDLGLAISLEEDGKNIQWLYVWANQFEEMDNGWKKVTISARIEKYLLKPNSAIKVFAMSFKGKNLIDNMKVTVFKKK